MAETGSHSRTELLLRMYREEKVTSAFLPPYMLYDMLQYQKSNPFKLEHLRNPLISGSTVILEVLKQGMELIPGLRFSYGSTEVIVTDQPNDATIEEKLGNVGYPLPNTEVKIANENGTAVPIGVSGEICIRSFRTACLRYIGQDIKKKMFAGGWYRSGDSGTMDAQGRITVLGRLDFAIKRATELIYPAAVERVMVQHPKVHFVYVLGVPEARVGQEVCACVVPKEGVDLQESELVEFANKKFMSEGSSDSIGIKPKYFIIMQSLPLTLIGKFDSVKINDFALEYLQKQ